MESLIAVAKYLYLMGVWFWLGTVILQNEKHVYTAIFLWSISAAFTSAGAIAQLVWGDIIPGVSPAAGRMTGLTEHVNDLGGVNCVVLMPALALASHDAIGRLRKYCLYVITFLITAGLILSVSVSGLIAAIISFIIFGVMSRTKIKNIAMFVIIIFACLMIVSFSLKHGGISVLDRLTDVAEQKLYYETSASRMEVYRLAWESISRNPLIGVGMGPYAGITETGDSVHNVILLNWYESGVLGLIGILLVLLLLVSIGVYQIRTSKSENERLLSVSLFASFVAFLVIGMAQPIYFKRFGWISSSLIMALYVSRRKPIITDSMHIISARNNSISS